MCHKKVWQPPNDPDSKRCGECHRKVAPIVIIKEHKVRNPLTLNAHMCKRCGRVVCDSCYTPDAVDLQELGFTEPQRVCKRCVQDIATIDTAPEEEDLGTFHDEGLATTSEEKGGLRPYWNPICRKCNIAFSQPPPQWLCTTCRAPVWQQPEAQDSTLCPICSAPFPKVRCHSCGQLVCASCGAFGQPLPQRGFNFGQMLTVCKSCYEGAVFSVDKEEAAAARAAPKLWPRPMCPTCKQPFSTIPSQWTSKCHSRRVWQPPDDPASKQCAVCHQPVCEVTREHCRKCGRIVCLPCSQYREPIPDRGYPEDQGQIICKLCFNPKALLLPDVLDCDFWPPSCLTCGKKYVVPPERWACPNGCGLVWQPAGHVCSRLCFCCGKAVPQPINCRYCGRVMCAGCERRMELPARGFAAGLFVPVCDICTKQLELANVDSQL